MTSKNKTDPICVWTTEQPHNVLIADEKVPMCLFPDKSSIELFHYILSDELIEKIVEYTNERIEVEYNIGIDLQYLK